MKKILKVENTIFKIGDKIKLKPKYLRPSSFLGGLTISMEDLIENTEELTIASFYDVGNNYCVIENKKEFAWDLRHFEKVKKKEEFSELVKRVQKSVDLKCLELLENLNHREDKNKIVIDTTDDKKTTATYKGKIGVSKVNTEEDKYNTKIGIMLATARALGFEENIVQGFVDVIYDDFELDWGHVSTAEILEELHNRVK